MSTVRFDGLYQSDELWLRFRPGNIAEARFIDGNPLPAVAAHLVARGNGGFGPGSYTLKGQVIEIEINFPTGTNHYSGRVEKEGMKLTYADKETDHPAEPYIFHPLSEAELAPGPATRIWDLRAALKDKTIDPAVVHAAAALGDQVAVMALNTPNNGEAAKRLAAIGPEACVRALLAMCWTYEGQLYYPTQSEASDGGRKSDEGKVLRAFAQWCIKSDKKALTKVDAEFSEMERLGADYEFMKRLMLTLRAKSEAERAKAMEEALRFHIDQDPLLAYESARDAVGPWLIGDRDPLADLLKRIK